MAKKKKTNGAGAAPGASPEGTAGAGHNVVNLDKMRRDALGETYKLDCEIQVLLDKYIVPLRAAKTDIKKRLNDDANITRRVFAARYAAYRLEADAMAIEDGSTIEALKEFFEISPVGHQMDWLDDAAEAAGATA